ncbi:hypothetical protein TanjilG_25330 [Lupinus angustifolius]|uniref:BSD domain-containing protein n=1 Tax=Lupinus angustifolius TaxID=3871 RepID=A0A4P1RVS2_LUPAN|nr:PREDICTED: uncharacterized protein LOC109351637 [Lupinus angustifolius]XP_019448723.1 PREDICTED: uncharacterized protein LOC109351637 [Lupinus angustifolius]XP_019448732.1 PREDICTED: uncharacterized protein LOC109351637 [Lupinus angustifolius]OIW18887.1 hypothetical protein TanjilG_25330 [Lupinus angustifolius]
MEWLRRNLSRTSTISKTLNPQSQSQSKSKSKSKSKQNEEEEEECIYGITQQLINHVKSFTLETFKNFPLQDEYEESESTSTKVLKDLSQWQEKHAILILSRVKEIAQLRFVLCPRHLKEKQFWKIYFKLARSHVFEYELRAIQQEKLKRMATEDEKSSDNNPNEIEMAEAKPGCFIESLPPS